MTRHAEVEVARVQPSDRAGILGFLRSLDAIPGHPRALSSRAVPSGSVRDARQGAVVARDEGGRVVGLAQWRQTRGGADLGELEVVVADSHRRRGIATAMLQDLAGDALQAGVGTWLLTTSTANRPALRLVRELSAGAVLVREGVVATAVTPVRELLPDAQVGRYLVGG